MRGRSCVHYDQWIIDDWEPRPLPQEAAKRRIPGSAWGAVLGVFRNSQLKRARKRRLAAA